MDVLDAVSGSIFPFKYADPDPDVLQKTNSWTFSSYTKNEVFHYGFLQ